MTEALEIAQRILDAEEHRCPIYPLAPGLRAVRTLAVPASDLLLLAQRIAALEAQLAALAQKDAVPVNSRDGCEGSMTPERVAYFLRRFKNEEKLLGPHEQWALDVAIAAFESHPAPEPAGLEKAVEALAENSWSLVCKEYPIADTGDADVGYEVVSYHMARPKERVEGAGATPVEALRAAGLLPHLSPSPQVVGAKIPRKGLEAATDAYNEFECGSDVDHVRKIVRAYLSTVIPAETAAVVEEWRKAAEGVTPGPWRSEPHITGISWLIGPTHVERGIGPQGEDLEGVRVVAIAKDTVAQSDWIARCSPDAIAGLLTLIERLAASQAETRRQALEEVEAQAEQIMLDVANEWHRQVGIDEVLKSKLVKRIADTVATGVFSKRLRALIDQPNTEGGADGE